MPLPLLLEHWGQQPLSWVSQEHKPLASGVAVLRVEWPELWQTAWDEEWHWH